VGHEGRGVCPGVLRGPCTFGGDEVRGKKGSREFRGSSGVRGWGGGGQEGGAKWVMALVTGEQTRAEGTGTKFPQRGGGGGGDLFLFVRNRGERTVGEIRGTARRVNGLQSGRGPARKKKGGDMDIRLERGAGRKKGFFSRAEGGGKDQSNVGGTRLGGPAGFSGGGKFFGGGLWGSPDPASGAAEKTPRLGKRLRFGYKAGEEISPGGGGRGD